MSPKRYEKQHNWHEEKYLREEYGSPEIYGIRWNWIKHIYKINGFKVNKAEAVLKNDLKVIKTIEDLHDQRNKKEKEQEENKFKTANSHHKTIVMNINSLKHFRNSPFRNISESRQKKRVEASAC
ncbi:hypothetical protein CAEBREN_17237 [Caenorhabditis brenneri]|uniref:Uncharacterized protein n=1 Tax=Caenorhabditis brenneri TaxID=135651 RepID=G0MM76_CAEBE|nr:hypothetical protein CAEBREN_17237 [Caenorhabditis brenneri]